MEPVLAAIGGALFGSMATFLLGELQANRRERRSGHLFVDGLRRDLRRCQNLSLNAPHGELLNPIALPFVDAYALEGRHAIDVPGEAQTAILNVHYCLARYRRFVDTESACLPNAYSEDYNVKQQAEYVLEHVRDAAISELEMNLKCCAERAIKALGESGRIASRCYRRWSP